ncbi:MAG: hypothetical protein AB1489_42775, partial [Acidobacteriota bacterium]
KPQDSGVDYMTLLTISALDSAKDSICRYNTGERKLIGVGVLLSQAQPQPTMQLALIDVTEEVLDGQLDTDDPQLVNAFVHHRHAEIQRHIEESLAPIAMSTAGGR